MDQEITFAGLSNTPSGHLCADGQLSLCIGLVPMGGELAPAAMPMDKYGLPAGYEFVCEHTTPLGSRIIAVVRTHDAEPDILYWSPAADKDLQPSDFNCIDEFESVRSVAADGKILAIATSQGLIYAHWTDAGYAVLDLSDPPSIEFELHKAGCLTMEKRYAVPSWMASTSGQGWGDGAWTTHPATAEKATDSDAVSKLVLDDFKSAVSAQIEAQGYFHSPFFVRYALRLHDGTHILPSPPVLMLPSLLPPMLKANATASGTDGAVLSLDASGMEFFSLRYRVRGLEPKKLGPYVAAIDIFITDSEPTFSNSSDAGGIVSYLSIVKHRNLHNSTLQTPQASTRIFAGQWSEGDHESLDRYVSDSDLSKNVWHIKPNPSLMSSLLMKGHFHLAGSIPASEVQAATEFSELRVCNSSSEAILSQPELCADESDLARRIRPDVVWSDGNGIVAGGGELALHKPWPLIASTAFVGHRLDPAYLPTTVTVYSRSLANDGNSSTANGSQTSPRYSLLEAFPHFLYVPDPGAYRLEVRQGENAWSLSLKRHPSLPGAYWMGDLLTGDVPAPVALPQLFTPDTQASKTGNSLYVSHAGCPFAFDFRAEVGHGAIRYIAPALRTVSSGQFGQYTLYVFTSCGVWVIPASGGAPPVCISPDAANSIALCGTVVTYTTDSGVYELSGTRCECISLRMRGCGDIDLLS